MSVELGVKVVDELVFTKTGEHLNSLQREVLRGAWYGKTYPEIAEEVRRTDGYVREVGAELWKLLSEVTGDTVDKGSFRAMAERLSSIREVHSNVASIVAIANDCSFNISTDSLGSIAQGRKEPKPTLDPAHIPMAIPSLEGTVGRDQELASLSRWMLEERCRLIGIWGLAGVGKSRLAALLVDRCVSHFHAIAWANLTENTQPEQLEAAIAASLTPINSPDSDGDFPCPLNLFEHLRHQRCLIILDGLETGFVKKTEAGTWQPTWEVVAGLLDQAARTRHSSCFLILSREAPATWSALEDKLRRTRSLTLGGLDPEVLAQYFSEDVADPEYLADLITAYRGHPGWVAAGIKTAQTWFGSRLEAFLDFGSLLPTEIATSLGLLAQRLSDPEWRALELLARASDPVALPMLRDHLGLSPIESLKLIESLQRRCLLERSMGKSSATVQLSPVLRAWVSAGGFP